MRCADIGKKCTSSTYHHCSPTYRQVSFHGLQGLWEGEEVHTAGHILWHTPCICGLGLQTRAHALWVCPIVAAERQEVADRMDDLQETMGHNNTQWSRARKSLRSSAVPPQEWAQKDVMGCLLGLVDSSAAQGTKLLDTQGEILGIVAKMMQ